MPATQGTSDSSTERLTCVECGKSYTIREYLDSSSVHWDAPDHYGHGCNRYCLPCWLGVGPKDIERLDAEGPDVGP